jgi:hypothetical protein
LILSTEQLRLLTDGDDEKNEDYEGDEDIDHLIDSCGAV